MSALPLKADITGHRVVNLTPSAPAKCVEVGSNFAELFEAAMQCKLHWMIPPRETRGQRAAPRALRSLRTTFNHGGGVVPALFAWTQIYCGTLVGWPRAYCAPTPAAKQSCMVTKLPACKRVGAPLGFPSHTINQKIGAILSSLRALTGARIFMVNRM
jgi:hypothetical protein